MITFGKQDGWAFWADRKVAKFYFKVMLIAKATAGAKGDFIRGIKEKKNAGVVLLPNDCLSGIELVLESSC